MTKFRGARGGDFAEERALAQGSANAFAVVGAAEDALVIRRRPTAGPSPG